MAKLILSIVYGKHEGLVYNSSELASQYLHGIPLCTRDGRRIPDNTLKEKIRLSQIQIEEYLNIKINRQIIEESRDMQRGEYFQWGYIRVTYPVRKVVDLTGFVSTTKQVMFPGSWVSSKETNQEDMLYRNIHIIPAGSDTTFTNSVVFVGITPNAGLMGSQNIPNYWRIEYCTGFKVVPANVRDIIAKLAAIQILSIAGNFTLGPGVSSQSLSLDGLSQSVSSTKSGSTHAYSALVKQYADEIKESLPQLKDWYKGMIFSSM